MKIHFDLPWGGRLMVKWEPMSKERFNAICVLIGIFIVGSGILKFFTLLVGA